MQVEMLWCLVVSECQWATISFVKALPVTLSESCHSVWKGHTHNTIKLGHWAQPFCTSVFQVLSAVSAAHSSLAVLHQKKPSCCFRNIMVRDECAEIKLHVTPHCMQKTSYTFHPGELKGKALRLTI